MTVIISGTDGVSDVDGTAGTPALRGTDANTGIFFGADIIGFSEGGAECARFNADAQFVAAAGTALLPVITTTGDVNTGIFFPAADNIGFATNGVIRGRWTTDGLCFGSDTAAANALDDYEQGTWTPTYLASTTDPTITYQAQNGSYVKIGEFVYINFEIETSVATGGSGDLRIGGLPFTTANSRFPGGGVVTFATAFTTNAPDAGFAAQNATHITLTHQSSATSSANNIVGNLTNGASKNFMKFTGSFRSA